MAQRCDRVCRTTVENRTCTNGLPQSSSFTRSTTVPRAADEHRNYLNIATVISVGRLSSMLSFALIAIPINLSPCQFAFNLFHFFFRLYFLFLWRRDVRQSMDLCECVGYLGYYANEIVTLQSPVCAPPDIVGSNLLLPRLKQYIPSATGARRTVLGRWTSHSLVRGVRTKGLSGQKCSSCVLLLWLSRDLRVEEKKLKNKLFW